MKRQKKGGRFGTLVFLIPTIIIIALVAFAILSTSGLQNGTLVISAQTSSNYYLPKQLSVMASVSGRSATTPYNLTLSPGSYTVTFSPLAWFYPPADRVVSVPGGKAAYAVGVYDPIVRTVLVAANSFNSSSIFVDHGVTPVVFINRMGEDALIQSTSFGRVDISPAGNFTYVFPKAGAFLVYMPLVPDSNVTISAA